ncbi:hypothetical protein [Caenispirillum bisanense]|uniref:Uncharacterized protein n=1 Tax=Caenispirillum bisanense TaxID=414052 RepID=A0A286GFM7_9PROT|nr:hypothetical protein [Caenispirillum bisanense]SOD94335.1 hypothetical protein SAMN05421508_103472 [Caenispirillum bisanense]
MGGSVLNPYHLAAGVMFLGLGVLLLGALIVMRERLARAGLAATKAQRGAEALLTVGGVSAMILGLGALALGVL